MELPLAFLHLMRTVLGDAGARRLEAALGGEPSVSVRLHPLKAASLLSANGVGQPVPWCPEGRYLSTRPSFTFDPLLHAGAYYVQEASSMFLSAVLRAHVGARPVVALDLCAAPGGKSTLARSALPSGSLLVSNEPLRPRAQVLAENLMKWGYPDTVVTQNYPDAFTGFCETFDLIMADVPCSGEGMFRKDEEAVADWSPENVALCVRRQREILTSVWPALKPGGLLVYSTCTFNPSEDEENVAWMVSTWGAEVLPVPVEAEWGVTGNLLPPGVPEALGGDAARDLPVYHFLPGTSRGEGFFLAVLRKGGESDAATVSCAPCEAPSRRRAPRRSGKGGASCTEDTCPAVCRAWVQSPDAYTFFVDTGGTLRAFPKSYYSLFERLRRNLTVIHAGIPVAECKGRDWQPMHGLALSTAFSTDAFPRCELTYEQAVSYLRKEALSLPSDVPRGWVCLTYRGVPLGFAKQLGPRANNAYPSEWRIRSSHVSPFCLWE